MHTKVTLTVKWVPGNQTQRQITNGTVPRSLNLVIRTRPYGLGSISVCLSPSVRTWNKLLGHHDMQTTVRRAQLSVVSESQGPWFFWLSCSLLGFQRTRNGLSMQDNTCISLKKKTTTPNPVLSLFICSKSGISGTPTFNFPEKENLLDSVTSLR